MVGRPTRTRGGSVLALCAAVAAFGGMTACSDDGPPSPTTSSTSSASSTSSTVTTTRPTSSTAATLEVQVFFVDQDAFNLGVPPYVAPVVRRVAAGDAPRQALDALFEGPTPEESSEGLRLVASEATGVSDVRIEGGTAHVQLSGGCSSGGSTLTVAEEIVAIMRQFEAVEAVKIYDPDGTTERPDEPGDSIPLCLEP